jgi:hypothetical protein
MEDVKTTINNLVQIVEQNDNSSPKETVEKYFNECGINPESLSDILTPSLSESEEQEKINVLIKSFVLALLAAAATYAGADMMASKAMLDPARLVNLRTSVVKTSMITSVMGRVAIEQIRKVIALFYSKTGNVSQSISLAAIWFSKNERARATIFNILEKLEDRV